MKRLTAADLYFAHAATNNDPNCSDLQFIKDGKNYFFRNVPAPGDWDGTSDWTDDDAYIDEVVKRMMDAGEFEEVEQ